MTIESRTIALVALFICVAGTISAQDPPALTGLAPTPPMGFNTWNKFGCDVSEQLVRGMADAIVKSGMRDAGYRYIVIDDCWQVSRSSDGTIVPDPERFPSGMKAVADYVHSLGLKFGLYTDAGRLTCQKRPGSYNHEMQDARTYAAWGVDYLKVDWCNSDGLDPEVQYAKFRDALGQAGRPIVFSICNWGQKDPWRWGPTTGNLWRTTTDITDSWEGKVKWPDGACCALGVLNILDKQVGLETYAGPGHWNDPDMLEVGNGGMNVTEYQAHFSLWAILTAPLMAGNDLRNMTPEIRDILTNREAITVDQDPLGRQGRRVWRDGELEVWSKELQSGGRAVVLLNRSVKERSITATWESIGYSAQQSAAVRDLWMHKDLGKFSGKWSATVPSHGVAMVTVQP